MLIQFKKEVTFSNRGKLLKTYNIGDIIEASGVGPDTKRPVYFRTIFGSVYFDEATLISSLTKKE